MSMLASTAHGQCTRCNWGSILTVFVCASAVAVALWMPPWVATTPSQDSNFGAHKPDAHSSHRRGAATTSRRAHANSGRSHEEVTLLGGLLTEATPSEIAMLKRGSGVFCRGDSVDTRRCYAERMCVVKGELAAVIGPETVLEGVPDDRFNPALLTLGSVQRHNVLHASFVDIPSGVITSAPRVWVVRSPTLVMARFMPSNIMHALHDDVLPALHTLREIGIDGREAEDDAAHNALSDTVTAPFDSTLGDQLDLQHARNIMNNDDSSSSSNSGDASARSSSGDNSGNSHSAHEDDPPSESGHSESPPSAVLAFLDRHGRVDHARGELYNAVRPSRGQPVLYGTDLPANEPVCFLSAHLGVSKATTWYDYGFHQPQGPLNASGTTSASAVRASADRLARRLGIPYGVYPPPTAPSSLLRHCACLCHAMY
jgi:hypothetical protein